MGMLIALDDGNADGVRWQRATTTQAFFSITVSRSPGTLFSDTSLLLNRRSHTYSASRLIPALLSRRISPCVVARGRPVSRRMQKRAFIVGGSQHGSK